MSEPELCVMCARRMTCQLREAICYGDGRSMQPDISISYCSRFYTNLEKERDDVEASLIALQDLLA